LSHGKTGKAQKGKLEEIFFLTLLVCVSILFAFLLRPFFGAIFWASILGLLFQPLQRNMVNWFRGRSTLAALTTLTIALLIAVVPVLLVLGLLLEEVASFYLKLQKEEFDFGLFFEQIRQASPKVRAALNDLPLDIDKLKEQLSSALLVATRFLVEQSVAIGQQTLKFFVNFGLMVYLAFFTLRDGLKMLEWITAALPLEGGRSQLFFAKFTDVTKSTVKGNLVVALVQGALGGLIFWILALPAPVLWGVVMAFLSLLPLVGASLVWIPAAIYLFITGSWIKGIILVVYGSCVVGLIDNFLRPILVGKGTKLPDYLVLFSTLGGFVLFGMNGFVIGPLIAAFFVALWDIFAQEMK